MRSTRLFSWLALVAMAAAVAAGLFLLAARRPAGTASLEELPREQLVLREGQLFKLGETNPFSGFLLEAYASGERKSRSQVQEGRLHGLSEGWYTNGAPQVSESFVAGVSHGLRTKWHPNGQMLSQVTVSNGVLEGVFRRWTEQGSLSEEVSMRRGQPDGVSRAFYASGFLRAEAQLRAGQLVENRFWKDGERPPLASEQ